MSNISFFQAEKSLQSPNLAENQILNDPLWSKAHPGQTYMYYIQKQQQASEQLPKNFFEGIINMQDYVPGGPSYDTSMNEEKECLKGYQAFLLLRKTRPDQLNQQIISRSQYPNKRINKNGIAEKSLVSVPIKPYPIHITPRIKVEQRLDLEEEKKEPSGNSSIQVDQRFVPPTSKQRPPKEEKQITPSNNQFDNFAHTEEYTKRKVGRPFKGTVEELTKEPNVPERRSVLRGFKKFYAKKEFESIEMAANFMKEIFEGLDESDLYHIKHYMEVCRNTQSADHYRKKVQTQTDNHSTNAMNTINISKDYYPTCSQKYQYDPLVGDPCYRYNKCAKEKFFKNIFLSYLFIQFIYYYGPQFLLKKQWRSDKNLANKGKINILKMIIQEFVCLGIKTLDRNKELHPDLKRKVDDQVSYLNQFLLRTDVK